MSDFEKKVLEFKNKLDQTQDVKLVETIRSEIFGKTALSIKSLKGLEPCQTARKRILRLL